MNALVDTRSFGRFIKAHNKKSRFKIIRCDNQVAMKNVSLIKQARGYLLATLELDQTNNTQSKFLIIPNLCCKVMLGYNFLKQHSVINLPFGGWSSKPVLNICGLAAIIVQYTLPFGKCNKKSINQWPSNLEDKKFIRAEVVRIPREGIIKESRTPWRAQVLLTIKKNNNDINRIISECSKLAQKEYKTRHDWVGKVIHRKMCRNLNLTKRTNGICKTQHISLKMTHINSYGTLTYAQIT